MSKRRKVTTSGEQPPGCPVLPVLAGAPEFLARAERQRQELVARLRVVSEPGPPDTPDVIAKALSKAASRMVDLLLGHAKAEYWAEERWRDDFWSRSAESRRCSP